MKTTYGKDFDKHWNNANKIRILEDDNIGSSLLRTAS